MLLTIHSSGHITIGSNKGGGRQCLIFTGHDFVLYIYKYNCEVIKTCIKEINHYKWCLQRYYSQTYGMQYL